MLNMTPSQLKEIQALLGLSTADFAAILHTTVRTVDRWKRGDRAIPGVAVVALECLIREKHKEGM